MSHGTLLEVSCLNENLLNSRHRTAAVYVTTSLYDFHERQAGLLEVAGHGRIQAEMQENMWDEVVPTFKFNIFNMGFDMISNLSRFSLCSTNTSSNSSRSTCTSASLTRWFKHTAPHGNIFIVHPRCFVRLRSQATMTPLGSSLCSTSPCSSQDISRDSGLRDMQIGLAMITRYR